MRVSVPLEAMRPLARGRRDIPIRTVLIGNVQKLLTEWIGQKRVVGDKFTIEIVKEEENYEGLMSRLQELQKR